MTNPGDDTKNDRLIAQLAIAGWNENEIAAHVNATPEHVVGVLTAWTNNLATRYDTHNTRATHVYAERLEVLVKASWPKAVKGDIRAVETARRLLEQQARLYGIGEPDDDNTAMYDGPPLLLVPDPTATAD